MVVAKDTPNFIGNHIALYGVVRTLEAVGERPLHHRRGRCDHRAGARPPGQRDVPHDGPRRHRRPRARDAQSRGASGIGVAIARRLRCRAFLQTMLDRGMLGEKTGKGFYERRKSASGESEIWTLDLNTFEYRPEAVGAPRFDRSGQDRSTTSVSASRRCLAPRTRPDSSCARRSRRRSFTPLG